MMGTNIYRCDVDRYDAHRHADLPTPDFLFRYSSEQNCALSKFSLYTWEIIITVYASQMYTHFKQSLVHVLFLIHSEPSHSLTLCKNQYILSIYWSYSLLFTYCLDFTLVLRHNLRAMLLTSFQGPNESRWPLEQLKRTLWNFHQDRVQDGHKTRIGLTMLWNFQKDRVQNGHNTRIGLTTLWNFQKDRVQNGHNTH